MRRVTRYDELGLPVWERIDEAKWSSPYHQITIEIETRKGVKRIPVNGIRKSSRLIRSASTDRKDLFRNIK